MSDQEKLEVTQETEGTKSKGTSKAGAKPAVAPEATPEAVIEAEITPVEAGAIEAEVQTEVEPEVQAEAGTEAAASLDTATSDEDELPVGDSLVVVNRRVLKLQMGSKESVEVYADMRTFVTVTLGTTANVGDSKLSLGDRMEITEPVWAWCDSFSQLEIEWVK